MNHIGTVRLETERLILRKISSDDFYFAYKNWVTDKEVTKFVGWSKHENIEETKRIFTNWINEYEYKKTYRWIIVLKEIREPIGTIDVVDMDEELNTVTIGYVIGRKWWNRGIVTEAFSRVIKFLFEDIKVNRIEATHMPLNFASGKVMKKCGLKYEGTLRQRFKNKGEFIDILIYGILAEDYFNSTIQR